MRWQCSTGSWLRRRAPDRAAATTEAGVGPDPRLRAGGHRPGGRVRLRGDAGVSGASQRGRPDDPRQLEPGDDHDRPLGRRRDLPRAAHGGGGRGGDRPRATGRAARRARWPDRAQPRDCDGRGGRVRPPPDSAPWHAPRGNPHGRGSRGVPRPARSDRPALRAELHRGRPDARGSCGFGGRGARRDRPPGDRPAGLHARRDWRRHRRDRAGVSRAHPGRPPCEPDQAGDGRALPRRLAGDRVRGDARRRRHLHRGVLDGERRSTRRPHRRLDRGRAGPDTD